VGFVGTHGSVSTSAVIGRKLVAVVKRSTNKAEVVSRMRLIRLEGHRQK
jgi:hypothetical protein